MTLISAPFVAVLTPLDDTLTKSFPRVTPGGQLSAPEISQAVSACHRWLYDRLEGPTTPWVALYQPTGQAVSFGRLAAARGWTAYEDAALAHLRGQATDVIARGGHTDAIVLRFVAGRQVRVAEEPDVVGERLAHAYRHVAVLDGRLIGGDPDGICSCGGFLIDQVHADVCPECVTRPRDAQLRCRKLAEHQACPTADPVVCEHHRCRGRAGVVPCVRGRDWCCGTCCS